MEQSRQSADKKKNKTWSISLIRSEYFGVLGLRPDWSTQIQRTAFDTHLHHVSYGRGTKMKGPGWQGRWLIQSLLVKSLRNLH